MRKDKKYNSSLYSSSIEEGARGAARLLTNNTGYSIKNWFLYSTLLLGALIILASVLVMVIDVLYDGKVDSSMDDLSKVINAVTGLFVASGLPKIAGEIFEKRNNIKNKQDEGHKDSPNEG